MTREVFLITWASEYKMKFQVPTFEIKGNLDTIYFIFGNPWWLSVKNLPANVGNAGSIPGPGRSHMQQGN